MLTPRRLCQVSLNRYNFTRRMTPPFTRMGEPELQELARRDPDRLIAQIHGARLAGEEEAAATATIILVLTLERFIRSVVADHVRSWEIDEVSDGATIELVRAVRDNPPELGSSVQLRVWTRQIVFRYCAGVTRKGETEFLRRMKSTNATYEDGSLKNDPEADDYGFEFAEYRQIVDRQLDLLNDDHRIIVEMRLIERAPSKEVSQRLKDDHGLTYNPNTIDQVASRFRKACAEDLEEQ
jgi:DNA-directed RNA polymerase specialized sigma24 family protein